MARVLITDGLDVKRESASIETFKPAAAESRSLKTPTTCGRLSPSMTRGSEPVALKVVRVGSAASVSAHPLGRSATGVESNTRSRRTTSTRAGASEDSGGETVATNP